MHKSIHSFTFFLFLSCLVIAGMAQRAAAEYAGKISMTDTAVRVAGEEVFAIPAPAGGFTAPERAIIVERNVNDALMSAADRSSDSVEVVTINHLPVIRIAGKHIVTVDTASAKLTGSTPEALAGYWADEIRKVLSDKARVNGYIAQLSGDYLCEPYSPPFRRAQSEAARLNHAAVFVRSDLPAGLVCSNSAKNEGLAALMKRDYSKAAEAFKASIAMEPRNARAHYGMGVALMEMGDIGGAVNELQLSRWLDDDDANVHLALGQCFETKGLYRDALSEYREASLLQPDNPEPVLYIADLREERNDIGKSVVELTAAEKLMPNSEYVQLRKKDQLTWRLIRPY